MAGGFRAIIKDVGSKGLGDYSKKVAEDKNLFLQSKYNFENLSFPSDLASEDMGHYMIININVPVDNYTGQIRGNLINESEKLPNDFSTVDILRFGANGGAPITMNGGAVVGNPTLGTGAQGGALAIPRYTRRIKSSIAIFMPTALQHVHENDYDEISLTPIAGKVVGAAIGGALSYLTKGLSAMIGSSVLGTAQEYLGTAAQIAGYPINPRVEVLYSTTRSKQYLFEFLMAPRNEKESEIIKKIISYLRFFSLPEYDDRTKGFTWIPPAEFDIQFYNRGYENLNIPRINTCILKRVEADYSPQGSFSTFYDGAPVMVRLSLGFAEVEIPNRLRVAQGF